MKKNPKNVENDLMGTKDDVVGTLDLIGKKVEEMKASLRERASPGTGLQTCRARRRN